ncbi:MAG: anthranilate/aminodeoxychorismate synthase component II [Gammaproteobacteria bacterium]|nr:aminodeoxychorismate/anthranilate synthase component II [Gammaproteobacteria bacterium]NIP90707.1 aminodeoxychorismate/anthranilate synthase component II [Gammaproteobacteria bacterium]NIR25330.1 aminodeoxychorismate/anthranilate synthase component II [Gammaproteobacteria bacterium]NIS07026.1 aminodeoxychorismate/anthranilate synthase component II [Gammaproteobacteria bacterium]NIU41995.1 anthranilate/aminodeoxychorismate synthase component II [Gammaproteobacteria bacterium]
MLLMIDNYDSFTYNLVQYLGELGEAVTVYRNDRLSLADIAEMAPRGVVISPGPCTPNEAGVSLAVIERFADRIPILGVCLGHQCIAQAFGARIVHAHATMHGKTSMIRHQGTGVFCGLPSPFEATRYHSLVVAEKTLPACLRITARARSDDGRADEIMGVEHTRWNCVGVQFHPEAILTRHGHRLLANFLAIGQPRVAQAGLVAESSGADPLLQASEH